jgi:hypothetical protein
LWKYPSSGDESLIPFDQDDTSKILARLLPLSSALPHKQVTNTVAKMANYPPANFDVNLEHIVTVILKLSLAHPLALALSQSFVNTFGLVPAHCDFLKTRGSHFCFAAEVRVSPKFF